MSDRAPAGFLDGVFDRTLANLRGAWREIALSARGVLSGAPRPDLPEDDIGRLQQQMLSCLDGRGGEVTARARAADLGRSYLALNPAGRERFLRLLAEEFDDGTRDIGAWITWLRERFDHGAQGGVHLLTLHRAKGLEWDAVFLPRIEERELPCKQALGDDKAIAEERRLLYVGITRARKHLALTWTRRPSRFLAELGVETRREAAPRRSEEELPPAFRTLKQWRLERAKADEVPAYVVFHNSTLEQIAERGPRTLSELAAVPGVGPTKLERYGEEVLAALAVA